MRGPLTRWLVPRKLRVARIDRIAEMLAMSIIFDYPSIKQERDKDDTVVSAPEKEHKAYLVYCNCRGQDMLSSSCGCFGTPKFYGPDRR